MDEDKMRIYINNCIITTVQNKLQYLTVLYSIYCRFYKGDRLGIIVIFSTKVLKCPTGCPLIVKF